MVNPFNNLTQQQKGIVWIVAGLILLLHTLGIIERGLYYIIIFGSLAMISYGFILVDGVNKIKALLKKSDQ